MAEGEWAEVDRAAAEGRREVVLCGPEAATRLKRSGLPPSLWALRDLTHLRISAAGAEQLPADVVRLRQLRELLLFGNRLSALPSELLQLRELRHLDFADNQLKELPDLSQLPALTLLNVRGNQLTALPRLSNLRALQELDASGNNLTAFPDLCYKENERLADLRLGNNQIVDIPADVNLLPLLKNLDLNSNKIQVIPLEVAEIIKLKDLNLKGNNITDNRLRKLIDQCQTKQVINFIRSNCSRAGTGTDAKVNSKKKGKGNAKAQKKTEVNAPEADESAEPSSDVIRVIPFNDDIPNVKINESVKAIRAHIVCCIVRGLKFDEDSFKKFIQVQTKLHDTICEKRNGATIATHDLAKIPPGDLLYTALPPFKLTIQPLMRAKTYSGLELYSQLRKEADDLRKEKKRAVYSGIHKYLYLLEGKSLYPCLEDSKGTAISFPPITNSDITKMSLETTDMMIEVTSSQNQTICRKIMDTLLLEILNMGLGGPSNSEDVNNRLGTFHQLQVQQMRIVDLEGKMRVIYPSKVDLYYEDKKNLKIIRES